MAGAGAGTSGASVGGTAGSGIAGGGTAGSVSGGTTSGGIGGTNTAGTAPTAGKGGTGGNAGNGGSGGAGGSTGGAGAGTGGTAGGAAGGGGTGGTGNGTCAVQPINPNATAQARKLLCYLYSLYGNSVLSGQQETSWNRNPADDVNWIYSTTTKYPAILGGDYLYPNGTSDRAIAYWNAGGIPMIRYHMGAPPQDDSYDASRSSSNIENIFRSGTAEYTSFREKLDYSAAELQKLQAANVAVIWAPFHEVQPNGWFWWSKGTGEQFARLWRTMYDYFTTTKRLNNLVWLMPFSGSPNSAYYPGKMYADVTGPDTYGTNQPFVSMYSATRAIVGTTIPIALHETGVVPNPDAMFNNNAAPWVLFSIWAGYQRSHNTPDAIRNTYANRRTITRDEVPNLK